MPETPKFNLENLSTEELGKLHHEVLSTLLKNAKAINHGAVDGGPNYSKHSSSHSKDPGASGGGGGQ